MLQETLKTELFQATSYQRLSELILACRPGLVADRAPAQAQRGISKLRAAAKASWLMQNIGLRSFLTTFHRAMMLALLWVAVAYGQSPWEIEVNNLSTSFTGPIAKGLSLVAIVVGGLTFAYSEGASKKVFAGIIFGIGMAVSAASFLSWLIPS